MSAQRQGHRQYQKNELLIGESSLFEIPSEYKRCDEEALVSTEVGRSGQVGGVQRRVAWASRSGNTAVFLWMTFGPWCVACFVMDRFLDRTRVPYEKIEALDRRPHASRVVFIAGAPTCDTADAKGQAGAVSNRGHGESGLIKSAPW